MTKKYEAAFLFLYITMELGCQELPLKSEPLLSIEESLLLEALICDTQAHNPREPQIDS